MGMCLIPSLASTLIFNTPGDDDEQKAPLALARIYFEVSATSGRRTKPLVVPLLDLIIRE